MKKTSVLTALIFTSTAMVAYAHGGATGVVKERMDAMVTIGKAVKEVTPMMRGETEFDAAIVRSSAETIGKHSGTNFSDLFPEGTGGAPSEARDTVWTNWSEFSELSDRLRVYADGLARAADNGLKADSQDDMSSSAMMGSSSMMGSETNLMGGGKPEKAITADDIAQMPVDSAFALVSQTCSACHTKFRVDSK
ncbi:c-type cytochrome [Aliiroseovarius crassostreae]|uniref:c-type cytochrome n=1 Tax=Aliiroseovarius crassostreae TaxID=154981 RepID=UPI00220B58A2|nr:cytochrome c [Aliiroseovarius crassostreae]UWQ00235.1 cytochrome c [Aliiroseovarius crassostreae]